MWFLIFLLLVAGGVAAYVFRVKLLAKVLGQSETRVAGALERRKRR
ncbi:hypothetical protein [Nocardioides alkalitolerans]|nr:hypothetical protein [Nocardioides alkalitolerans]